MIHPLAITYRPPASLVPDPRNARTHSRRQVEQIRASIEAFGFTYPILADPDGKIIAGHGRLLAAKAQGLAEVPVITLSGLSEAQQRALLIADNKIALNAGWDLEILLGELAALSSLDFGIDVTLTGFSTGEIDVILNETADPDDEVIPALPAKPRTRTGDIWVLGDHRIGCGDCRDQVFLRRIIGPGTLVDAAFLDPPYNVPISGHAVAKGRHREFAFASGEMSEAEFRSFLSQTLGAAVEVSRPGAVDRELVADGAMWLDLVVISFCQASTFERAPSRILDPWMFGHSERNLPLNNSMGLLTVGLPGREKSRMTPF